MKKTLFLVLVIICASISTTAFAGKKKDKKNKKAETEQPVVLTTPSDSTSYAAGYSSTDGLLPYLINRLHVDTTYLDDFVRGYKESMAKANDPAYIAYVAGCNIAAQASDQIIPSVSKDLVGTDDSIAAVPFNAGFLAGVKQDTAVFKMEAARERVQKKVTEAREERNRIYKKENEDWLKSNATKPGVQTLPSGLQYKVLKNGNGPKPKSTDKVEVVYEGKTINGKVFDATSKHGGKKTDSFRCDQVIKGWTEALTNMNVGSKWEIYIPQELAYGSREAGQIKPYSTLIFTVELVGIEEPEQAQQPTTQQAQQPQKKAQQQTKKQNKKHTNK